MRTLISLGLIVVTAACSTSARLYPIEGPISQAAPTTILAARVDGILGNNGKLTVVQPDGSECQGEWSSAAGISTTFASGSLISQYGPTYGFSTALTSGGGQNQGQAIAVCADGNRYQIDFVTGGGTASGFGVAKDTKGNVFRVLF